jgi:ornithine cyclodeaminase/alanine dehydrogenase-like protein (mu-crystallin family)
MKLAIIGRETVRRHLTFARCIPVVRQAMIDLSLGRTRQTPRQIVPTDALARPDARRLAVPGTGEQARAHAAAICEVRLILSDTSSDI